MRGSKRVELKPGSRSICRWLRFFSINELIIAIEKHVLAEKGSTDYQKVYSIRRSRSRARRKFRQADWLQVFSALSLMVLFNLELNLPIFYQCNNVCQLTLTGCHCSTFFKLALRAGNEKDEDEADTVGCCSLRCEHIKLHEELDGKPYVVEFDFPGKDSIRYQNSVSVPKRVFKNLKIFIKNKQGSDDLFDRLNTTTLNQYLRELMDGLTAKVFRTYNASRTLEEQLQRLTNPDDMPAEKVLAYNRANRTVAVLCNHQRAVPKSFSTSMENLQKKVALLSLILSIFPASSYTLIIYRRVIFPIAFSSSPL